MIDILGQTYSQSEEFRVNGTLLVVGLVIQFACAFIPAYLAGNKGYSFLGFFLFGFFCWLPALITSLVISPKLGKPQYYGRADRGYVPRSWQAAPQQSAGGPPAGWYPDPQADGRSRYWDGVRWTEHTS